MHPNFQDSSILVPVAELIFLPGHKPRKYYLSNQKVQPGCKPRKYYLVTKPENTTWSPTQKKIFSGPKPRKYFLVTNTTWSQARKYYKSRKYHLVQKVLQNVYLDTNQENIKCSQIQKVLPGPKPRMYTWTQTKKILNVPKSIKYYLVPNPERIPDLKPGNTTWSQIQRVLPGHKPRKY